MMNIQPKKILIVDDDDTIRRSLERYLTQEGYVVFTAVNVNDAILAIHVESPDLVLSDVYMPGTTGIEIPVMLKKLNIDIPVILMTGQDDMTTTIKAMQQGAYDYLTKPLDLNLLKTIVARLFETQDLSDHVNLIVEKGTQEYKIENVIVGRDKRMIEIFKTIGNVTQSGVTVLIEGESGTGKELIARAIHYNSSRSAEPFIAVNCTALAESLLESELFGHVKGSFTGATADKRGKFELAHNGTIFLDEIGEISQALQVKLLRVLQEREFERVGGDKTIKMSARVIAATNRDLAKEVAEGRFREDLYYRLNVVSIVVPPLRERKADIPILVNHLLHQINEELHKKVRKISDGAMERILHHEWRGNIRELQNILTRAVVLAKSDILDETLIPDPVPAASDHSIDDWKRTMADVEDAHFLRVFNNTGGNRAETAKILGISKPTVYLRFPLPLKEKNEKVPIESQLP
ncbi:MAG: sigma-54 dependent transcriptional regulator [Ignavibacteriota bacterium]